MKAWKWRDGRHGPHHLYENRLPAPFRRSGEGRSTPSLKRSTASPTCPRPSGVHKSKASAQDGHEAIRPTVASPHP